MTLLLLAAAASMVGAIGGLGGSVVLVPVLVLSGTPATTAAPLGLLSVGAGSLSAGSLQLAERSVNHRLGVSMELFASAGAVAGAALSTDIPERTIAYGLAGVAVLAALAIGYRRGVRNQPDPSCGPQDIGERIGGVAGAYPLGTGVVPYRPRRLAIGLPFMGIAGLVAGISGASGGFIKTPAASEIMRVPVKVAAATTTFTVGITSSAALLVFALQDRIDLDKAALVVIGSLIGGELGARWQARLPPTAVRRALSALLVVIAVVLVVRS